MKANQDDQTQHNHWKEVTIGFFVADIIGFCLVGTVSYFYGPIYFLGVDRPAIPSSSTDNTEMGIGEPGGQEFGFAIFRGWRP